MPESTAPSFIPKRTPSRRTRKPVGRTVYVFSYISYILITGSVIAAGAVFIYKLQVEAQLAERQQELARQVDSFKQSDMERVKEFEERLTFATERMDHHWSISRLLEAIETSTVATVQYSALELSRNGDEQVELTGAVRTDSFDSTLFQRGVLERSGTITALFVDGVALADAGAPGQPASLSEDAVVDFSLLMNIDPATIAYQGTDTPAPAPAPTPAPELGVPSSNEPSL